MHSGSKGLMPIAGYVTEELKMQDRVYNTWRSETWTTWSDVWLPSGPVCSEYRRWRCRSVAQTSALLHGNERPSLRTFAVTLQLELVYFRVADYLIFGYFACLCCVVVPCIAWGNYIINFTVLLCIIFMHIFYRVMKGIYQFAANLLSYIPTKYYWNRSTSDLVITKSKRVNFFETQCTYR